MSNIKEAREKIDIILDEVDRKIEFYSNMVKHTNERIYNLSDILCKVLNGMTGHKIYWAHKGWNKYETHTILKAEIGTVTTDFFGPEYLNKECIKIFIDDGSGFYIADMIGETLFFDETEAYAHTALGLKETT